MADAVNSVWAIMPAAVWAGALCWRDSRERRLPNELTIGGLAVALGLRLLLGGIPAFVNGVAGAALAGAFLLLPFLVRGAGGGDVKMLAAAGAMAGVGRVLDMLILVSVAGLVMGVAMMLSGGLSSARFRHMLRCLFDFRYDRAAGAQGLPPKESEAVRMPFSIPIAAGLLYVMVVI